MSVTSLNVAVADQHGGRKQPAAAWCYFVVLRYYIVRTTKIFNLKNNTMWKGEF